MTIKQTNKQTKTEQKENKIVNGISQGNLTAIKRFRLEQEKKLVSFSDKYNQSVFLNFFQIGCTVIIVDVLAI